MRHTCEPCVSDVTVMPKKKTAQESPQIILSKDVITFFLKTCTSQCVLESTEASQEPTIITNHYVFFFPLFTAQNTLTTLEHDHLSL